MPSVMGFFRKLFGGPEEEVAAEPEAEPTAPTRPAATTTDGGPYRGTDYVEVKAELPQAPAKQPAPIWDSWTEVFSLELGDLLPLRSLVYCGETKNDRYLVRRVRFAEGGVIVDWEVALPDRDALSDHLVCRFEDRIVIPRAAGVVAVHLVTGEPCWELPHPSKLLKRPRELADGDILLVFTDQSWMRVGARDGSCRAEGTVRSDREVETIEKGSREVSRKLGSFASYGRRRVDLSGDGFSIRDDEHKNSPEEPPGPAVGKYPIDEWHPKTWVALAGGRLATLLSRSWNDRTRIAVGIFEATSLEPLRLLELADTSWHCDCDARLIDDLLVVDVDVVGEGSNAFNAKFVLDAHDERVLGCFAEDRPSSLFDGEGRRTWTSPL
jgi:hypothetical protein